jgi:hypothetical protein
VTGRRVAGWGWRAGVAYYAHHLHRGTQQGPVEVESLPPGAQRLLVDWVRELGAPPEVAQGPATLPARQAAAWLARRYGAVARTFAVIFCREADTYLADPESAARRAAREEVSRVLDERRATVVVAHSLGSVVAYEALWSQPREVDLLLTLGSALGIPHVTYERLCLGPGNEAARGKRPPGVRRWVNIADVGDIVAIPRDLPARFAGIDLHREVSIGVVASHRVTKYLSCPAAAEVLAPYLT